MAIRVEELSDKETPVPTELGPRSGDVGVFCGVWVVPREVEHG